MSDTNRHRFVNMLCEVEFGDDYDEQAPLGDVNELREDLAEELRQAVDIALPGAKILSTKITMQPVGTPTPDPNA